MTGMGAFSNAQSFLLLIVRLYCQEIGCSQLARYSTSDTSKHDGTNTSYIADGQVQLLLAAIQRANQHGNTVS